MKNRVTECIEERNPMDGHASWIHFQLAFISGLISVPCGAESLRDFGRGPWKILRPMKSLIPLCALSLALGLVSAVGGEEKKDTPAEAKPPAKTPDFTDPSKLTEKAPETFKAQFDTRSEE